jgi:haloalkane dehalogenase
MGLSARLPEGAAPLRLAERILEFGAFIDFLESPLSEKEAPPRRALSKGEKIHLLVHDWGGPIALGWAVKNPSRVGSIVFTNTGFRVPPGYKLPWELFLFRKMGPLASLLSGPLGLFTRGLTKLATVRPLSEAAREGFLAPYRIAAHRGAIQAFVDDIPLDKRHPSYFTLKEIHEGLASLKDVPARLIWGLQDFVFDASFFQDLRASFPRAGTLALPRAGHFLFEDEPLKIQRELLNFYASLKLF